MLTINFRSSSFNLLVHPRNNLTFSFSIHITSAVRKYIIDFRPHKLSLHEISNISLISNPSLPEDSISFDENMPPIMFSRQRSLSSF